MMCHNLSVVARRCLVRSLLDRDGLCPAGVKVLVLGSVIGRVAFRQPVVWILPPVCRQEGFLADGKHLQRGAEFSLGFLLEPVSCRCVQFSKTRGPFCVFPGEPASCWGCLRRLALVELIILRQVRKVHGCTTTVLQVILVSVMLAFRGSRVTFTKRPVCLSISKIDAMILKWIPVVMGRKVIWKFEVSRGILVSVGLRGLGWVGFHLLVPRPHEHKTGRGGGRSQRRSRVW